MMWEQVCTACECERDSEEGRGLVQLDLILTTPHTRVKASGLFAYSIIISARCLCVYHMCPFFVCPQVA